MYMYKKDTVKGGAVFMVGWNGFFFCFQERREFGEVWNLKIPTGVRNILQLESWQELVSIAYTTLNSLKIA